MGSRDGCSRWRYQPANNLHTYTRKDPNFDAERTTNKIMPGTVVEVIEEKPGDQGVTFLRIADGRGWLFDNKPGVGTMCVKEQERTPPREAAAAGQREAGKRQAAASTPPRAAASTPPRAAASSSSSSAAGPAAVGQQTAAPRAAAAPKPTARDEKEDEEESAPSRLGGFASMLGFGGRPAKETPPEAPSAAADAQPPKKAPVSGGEPVDRSALNEHVQKACQAIVKATVEEQMKFGVREIKAEFNAQLATLKEQMQGGEKRFRQELYSFRERIEDEIAGTFREKAASEGAKQQTEGAKQQTGAGEDSVPKGMSQQDRSELVALAYHQSQLRDAQHTLESRIKAIEEMGLQERLMAAATDAAEAAAALLASRTVRLEDAVAPLAVRVRTLEREALGAPPRASPPPRGPPAPGSPLGGAGAAPREGAPAGKARTLLDFGSPGPAPGKIPRGSPAQRGDRSAMLV